MATDQLIVARFLRLGEEKKGLFIHDPDRSARMKHKTLLTVLVVMIAAAMGIRAQPSAFNFQGRLNDGTSPANGRYDLHFKLFNAITGGTQVGPTLDKANTMLVNGVFSTTLDFGGATFTTGDLFLEISVRPNGSPNSHVVLGARQQIMSVPFAVRSANATQADNATNAQNAVNAQNAANAQNATNAQNANSSANSLALGGVAASNYARLSFANQGDLSDTNLSATGTLSAGGNTLQPESSNGFVKMMIAVTASGAIARCYNGVTGTVSTNCVSILPGSGVFLIDFPFQVSNRFWLVMNDSSSGGAGALTATVEPSIAFPNRLRVVTRDDGSATPLPFHLFVF